MVNTDFRYYDPQTGRFTVQDPTGLAGGLSFYQYGPKLLSHIDPLGLSGDKINVYKDASYYGTTDNAVKSRAPVNGQSALDNSVQVKPTSPGRVGVDISKNEIVVLDKTHSFSEHVDENHGHVRNWDALDNKQQSVLIRSGKTTKKERLVEDRDKLRLVELLNTGDPEKVADTLLYIAHNIKDSEWAEGQSMRMANSPGEDISGLALTCSGHIARINGKISKNIVIPFLKEKIQVR